MNNIDVSYIDYDEEVLAEEFIVNTCEKIFQELNIDNWEVSILICSSDYIKELNKNYRNIDSPTDVLSFKQERFFSSEIYYAGDIVLAPEQVMLNSKEFNIEFEEEFQRLLIHGILHLKGMEHKGYEPDQAMLKKQEEILSKIKRYT